MLQHYFISASNHSKPPTFCPPRPHCRYLHCQQGLHLAGASSTRRQSSWHCLQAAIVLFASYNTSTKAPTDPAPVLRVPGAPVLRVSGEVPIFPPLPLKPGSYIYSPSSNLQKTSASCAQLHSPSTTLQDTSASCAQTYKLNQNLVQAQPTDPCEGVLK